MMIFLVKFLPFACLICLKTINLASARLVPNQKLSLESAATSDEIRGRSTSPPSEKLVPIGTLRGVATGDYFGWSVSLSYNGDALAVGSPAHSKGDLFKAGLVQTFRQQNSSQWVEAQKVTGGNEDDRFGLSTSLSGDGKWLTVGTEQSNGYAKLIEIETGKEITIVGDKSDEYFGQSVSVSQNGTRVAVATYDHVRVFGIEEDGSIFQIGENILTNSFPTVALSADGDISAIGERSYDDEKGRVRIFEWNSNEWKQLGGDMVGEYEYDYFGRSLDLTADGHKVIIGTDGGSRGGNYVKVYDYDGNDWEVVGGKLSGELNDDGYFGRSVSISDNGSRIVIGSPGFKTDGLLWRGRAVLYQFRNGTWNQLGDYIHGETANDFAGQTVAISGNGNIVLIGAPWADSERGYVMIYKVN